MRKGYSDISRYIELNMKYEVEIQYKGYWKEDWLKYKGYEYKLTRVS